MAIAETAQLAVRISLDDKMTGQLRKAEGSVNRFGKAVQRGIGRATQLATGAAIGGIVLLGASVRNGLQSLAELEKVSAATEQAILSTGAAAGLTAEDIRAMSERFENLNATMDDKVIQSAANVLLTFTNVRKDAFEPALEAALNLSTVLGTDLQSAAIQVGKALNDPIRGVTALRRAGIQLSKQQEEQIKQLVEQGDLYGAQRIVLAELTTQLGGQFARAGDTAAGRQAALADRIEDLNMVLAQKLFPIIDKVTTRLTDYLGKPSTVAQFEKLGAALAGIVTDENLSTAAFVIETSASAVSKAIGAFNQLPPEVKALAISAFALNKVTGGAVTGTAEAVGKLIGAGLKQVFAAQVTVIGGNVTGGPGGLPTVAGRAAGGAGILGTLAGAGGVGIAAGGVLGGSLLAAALGFGSAMGYQGPGTRYAQGVNPSLVPSASLPSRPPIVNVYVNVTANGVRRQYTRQNRYGRATGSYATNRTSRFDITDL